jgi:hypothetical protein
MSETTSPSGQFFQIVDSLIDGWCERRELGALRILLPAYPMAMGLNDDVHELRAALRHVRAMVKDGLTASEKDPLNQVIAIIDQTLTSR